MTINLKILLVLWGWGSSLASFVSSSFPALLLRELVVCVNRNGNEASFPF